MTSQYFVNFKKIDNKCRAVQVAGRDGGQGEPALQLEVGGRAAGRLGRLPEELLRLPEDEPRGSHHRVRLLRMRLPPRLPGSSTL